ncbi:6-phospho-beta-glucosidase [Actinoplanes sp. NPDC026619]|uniref:family 4 glycosyl hydrolase n=1 Tax=Actinoplanes sp. NPDC026619 TaxID=3155798 RepID=UPI0033F8EDB5
MKLCVVGGGSTYTPELIDGILDRRASLPITEIVLIDPDERRLGVVGPFAARMIAHSGGGIDLSWGTDLRAGIAGSAFVVSQFRVGGQAARHGDELLGRRFGLVGQETTGVGGFAKALRTVPIALEIARTVAELAPDARLLNFTNPAGLVTEALLRHVPEVHTIGLCNVPWNVRAEAAEALGVPFAELSLDYVGLNHLSWVRGFTAAGQNRTADILAEARAELGKQTDDEPGLDPEVLGLLGVVPNYYLRYYYDTSGIIRHQACSPTRASEVMKIEEQLLLRYADPALVEKPAELMERGGAYYSEAAAALMADLAGGTGDVHVVNVRNNGAVPGLPDDVVVEMPATVSPAGAVPIPTAALRPDMDALVRAVKDYELLTIEAVVSGDPEPAQLALLTHPLGPEAAAVRPLWDALREQNRGLLAALDG